MLLGFFILAYLSSGSMIKALMMAAVGLLLGSVGMDLISGKSRFTFNIGVLEDGVGLIPLIMGLFGISEILINIEEGAYKRTIYQMKVTNLLPNFQDWKNSFWPIIRGSFIGFFIGILPGPGVVTSAFASYGVEKRMSKNPETFGTGAIQGVAGPEAANNAATGGAFIPMFTLGIPSGPATALMLGAMLIYGLQPGPLLMKNAPELVWGTIASMYLGNAMLLVLNLPLIGLWIKIIKIPYLILFPLILMFCIIGCYSISYNISDLLIMSIFGIIGFFMKKIRFDAAPLILAFVIGPIFESSLRQSLMMSEGEFSIFATRPISLAFIAVTGIIILLSVMKRVGLKKRQEAPNKSS
jgi:putative tricarboxylic transport membrane protein